MIFPFEEGFSVSPGISTSVGIKKVGELVISNMPRAYFEHFFEKNVTAIYQNMSQSAQ